MKRVLCFFMLVLSLALCIAACGANEPTLIGTWEMEDDFVESYMVFNDDGTAEMQYGVNAIPLGTWSKNGDVLITSIGEFQIVELTSNTLVLNAQKYTRVK